MVAAVYLIRDIFSKHIFSILVIPTFIDLFPFFQEKDEDLLVVLSSPGHLLTALMKMRVSRIQGKQFSVAYEFG